MTTLEGVVIEWGALRICTITVFIQRRTASRPVKNTKQHSNVQRVTQKKILALLDEDGQKLLEQFLSAKADIISYEIAKAFEQGIILGSKIVLEICRK